jgi:hypothetical protein
MYVLQCYLDLYDKPLSDSNKDSLTSTDNLSEKDLKKKKSKQRRAAKKAEIQESKILVVLLLKPDIAYAMKIRRNLVATWPGSELSQPASM